MATKAGSTNHDCVEACSKSNECIAAAFTKNVCYLKNVRNPVNVNADVDAIYLISPPTFTTTATSATMGACADGVPAATQTASNGDIYGVCLGTDFFGNDVTSARAKDIAHCNNRCSKRDGCVATSFTNGVCYLKSSQAVANTNPNVIAAFKISSGTGKVRLILYPLVRRIVH